MKSKIKWLSSCILVGTTILSGLPLSIFADDIKSVENETSQANTEDSTSNTVDSQQSDVNESITNEPDRNEDTSVDTDTTVEDTKQDATTDTSTSAENNKTEDVSKEDTSSSTDESKEKVDKKEVPYVANTWYHPTAVNALGYTGEVANAIKEDSFLTSNWDKFKVAGNPFSMPQCTYFAWSRFYQVYGYDNGARGNGKTNAMEIVNAHGDTFSISSTPSAGAVFSAEKNTLEPEYGHVGFIEAYDGTYVWISEGNYTIGDTGGFIYIHKQTWTSFKAQYPDVVFAVPNEGVLNGDTKESVTLDESDKIDETTYVHQIKLLKSTTENPILDADGKPIKTYVFTTKADKIDTPTILDANGKKIKVYK